MRVISGERKGHKLKAPKGMETRPTEDRIKENLFNILKPLKSEAVVLDLFSGSGAIGIEFLSRGSKLAYFIDISQSSIDVIKENLNHTGFTEKSIILKRDSIGALNFFKSNGIKFDYIYMDPPFKNHDLLFNSMKLVADYDLLSEFGKLIVEHETNFNPVMESGALQRYDARKYGSKTLSFFKNREV